MTDTFDDLARAEARNQWSEPNRRLTRVGFVIGARWAKAHLEAQQPSVEDIADMIAGHPIGSGYYQTTLSIYEAQEIAESVHALLTGEEA